MLRAPEQVGDAVHGGASHAFVGAARACGCVAVICALAGAPRRAMRAMVKPGRMIASVKVDGADRELVRVSAARDEPCAFLSVPHANLRWLVAQYAT